MSVMNGNSTDSNKNRKRKIAEEKSANTKKAKQDLLKKASVPEKESSVFNLSAISAIDHKIAGNNNVLQNLREIRNNSTISHLSTTETKSVLVPNFPWRPWLASKQDEVGRLVLPHTLGQSINVANEIDNIWNNKATQASTDTSHIHQINKDGSFSFRLTEKRCKISTVAVQVPTQFELFKQPVKLMWPKSKAHDCMYREGESFLKNFPIQASIGFYDDASDDEDTFISSEISESAKDTFCRNVSL